MTGHIEIYLDIVSFYSYVAFKQLLDDGPILEAHHVQIDIKPFFLGGIMAASGNNPPWVVPAKAKYGALDADRSKKAVGIPEISPPEDLMAVSRTMFPLRALHYIKQTYPLETYLTTWHYFLHLFWGPSKRNLCEASELVKALAEVPVGFKGAHNDQRSQPLFSNQDVDTIMKSASEEKWKATLKSTVEEALKRGAFGAPWLWVTNSQGQSEPFFGTDRWHYVYDFLGLPYQKLSLLGPDGKAKL